MSVRVQNLDSIGAVLATFTVSQTAGSDDLTDADIGKAVTLTADYEVGPGADNDTLLGKLIDLTLQDADTGKRMATVQIGGICTLPLSTPVPGVNQMVVCGPNGTVKVAPALISNDPEGGANARGHVVAVNGSTDCTLILN
ncbi:MAG: hypothetical protein Kow0074_23640 [Candidatus Zixiibacteriota bacterium]